MVSFPMYSLYEKKKIISYFTLSLCYINSASTAQTSKKLLIIIVIYLKFIRKHGFATFDITLSNQIYCRHVSHCYCFTRECSTYLYSDARYHQLDRKYSVCNKLIPPRHCLVSSLLEARCLYSTNKHCKMVAYIS